MNRDWRADLGGGGTGRVRSARRRSPSFLIERARHIRVAIQVSMSS